MSRTPAIHVPADKKIIKFACQRAIAKWGIEKLVRNWENEGINSLSGVTPFCKALGVTVEELGLALAPACEATSRAWTKVLSEEEVAPVEVQPVN